MSHTIAPTQQIKTISDLLKALDELEKEHICKFDIVRGSGRSGQTASWKCECGKVVKSN